MNRNDALVPPDISRWRAGNVGIDYVHRREATQPGPRVLVTALMHGNEACGAIALDRLLDDDVAPSRGVLTLAFNNVGAYARIDATKPEQGRYVDEDMNRVWSAEKLDGPAATSELVRARALRPFADEADYLLDLHSMTDGDVPLALCGTTEKGRRLAQRVGFPATVVADPGHAGGVRLRDYGAFGRPEGEKAALLVECGQHFAAASSAVAIATTLRFLAALGMLEPSVPRRYLGDRPLPPQRFIEVTDVVTIESDAFSFERPCRSLEIIPDTGTLLAQDGKREVRTPYPNCVPIMPARKLARGLTAVRLGRLVAAPSPRP